jgi:hypothetical protein
MNEPKVITHQGGRFQFSLVGGRDSQKGGRVVVRMGIQPVEAGEILTAEQVLNSELGQGLQDAAVAPDSWLASMELHHINLSASNPGYPAAVASAPKAIIGAEKEAVLNNTRADDRPAAKPAVASKAIVGAEKESVLRNDKVGQLPKA